jgi:hypothetical protein
MSGISSPTQLAGAGSLQATPRWLAHSYVRHLAVSEVRLALPNFYHVTIRIANVAARLAVLILWCCDKFRSSLSP